MTLDAIEFAENPEPRCPCVLLLDTSGSMSGEKIAALNAGLQTFRDELLQDNLASKRVEVAIVAFDTTLRVLIKLLICCKLVSASIRIMVLLTIALGCF
jgi:uncharacterized protein YegL